jgi:MFS family permease
MNNEFFLKKSELHVVVLLAFIFALRVLGLFMILPVFARFAAEEYADASPSRIGIAVGIYGLSQAVLQIPFGFLSDYIGRKKIICLGLVLFVLGSYIAMLANNIYGVIIGRFLQGCGAIGCVVLASVADATRESVRIKSMGIVGITIGGSFIMAMILGPMLYSWIKLRGIFFFTALLATIALVLTMISKKITSLDIKQKMLANLFISGRENSVFMPKLLNLYCGVFVLHAILAALFLILPVRMNTMNIFDNHFVSVIIGSVCIALLAVKYVINPQRVPKVVLMCAFSIFISLLALLRLDSSLSTVFVSLLMFFSSFNILEATFPALVAKYAPASKKGIAMGIFSSSQFFGIFVGGLVGGIFFNQ